MKEYRAINVFNQLVLTTKSLKEAAKFQTIDCQIQVFKNGQVFANYCDGEVVK